jgi:hypothetical protein
MQAMAKFWNLQVCNLFAALALVLSSLIVSAHGCAKKLSDVDLLVRSGELTKGVPGTFSFVFVNNADHEVRIPPVSPCVGRYSGTVKLGVDFSPITPQTTGKGGGCGGGASHPPGILEQAKSWKKLKHGESLTISYKKTELFDFEEAPGAYEFWGEYQPPRLTAEEIAVLELAGIAFPCEPLKSTHVRFNRPG